MHREAQPKVNAHYSPKLATFGVGCTSFTLTSGCASWGIVGFLIIILRQLTYHIHPPFHNSQQMLKYSQNQQTLGKTQW